MDGLSNQLDLYTPPDDYKFVYTSYKSSQQTKP